MTADPACTCPWGDDGPPHSVECPLYRPQVRTQMSARKGHPVRYGYVITEADGSSWVSSYRWHTAEAARRAGEADADACRAGL